MSDELNPRPGAWVNGFVYFMRPIGMAGPVKVGWSRDPKARLPFINCWSPYPLEIAAMAPGSASLETRMQKCLRDFHYHGEWFHACELLSRGIDAVAAGASIEEAFDIHTNSDAPRPWRVRPMQSEAA